MSILSLDEHRCKCGKLLLKGIFFDGTLEIKCKRCGEINKIGFIKLTDDSTHYALIFNDHGIITNVSESACRILGYAGSDLIGESFTKINPTMPKEIGKKFIGPESVLDSDNHFQLDTFHKLKNGKNIPVTVTLKLYQPAGKGKYILLLSELKNAVPGRKLPDNKALDFLGYACDFYFCIDKTGIGEYMSPSMEKLFGFPPELVIGNNYFDFLPAKIKVEAKKSFKYFSANGKPFRVKHSTGTDLNGKEINTELYFTPMFDDSVKFTGYRVLGWVTKKPETIKRT